MRVAIFREIFASDLEKNINNWINDLENKYRNFEIIDMMQSSTSDGRTVISIWYKIMEG